jgi:hypothetical protein
VFYLPKPQVTGEPPKPFITNDPKTGWHERLIRTGVLAQKVGMTLDWDNNGTQHPLTVLQVAFFFRKEKIMLLVWKHWIERKFFLFFFFSPYLHRFPIAKLFK